MKTFRFVFLLFMSAHLLVFARAQQTTTAASMPALPSAILRPGLAELTVSLEAVRLDRWKLAGAVRDEVQTNLTSIHRDLDTTLPALLAAADAKPSSLANSLPVSRNVDALYDVLLRTLERARVSAPSDQTASLDRARVALDAVRRTFDASLQATAAAQEEALETLRSAPAPACVPATAKKKKPRS